MEGNDWREVSCSEDVKTASFFLFRDIWLNEYETYLYRWLEKGNRKEDHVVSVQGISWPWRLSSYWQWSRLSLIIQLDREPFSYWAFRHMAPALSYLIARFLKLHYKSTSNRYTEQKRLDSDAHHWHGGKWQTFQGWWCHRIYMNVFVCPSTRDDPEKSNTTYMEESQPTHGETKLNWEQMKGWGRINANMGPWKWRYF